MVKRIIRSIIINYPVLQKLGFHLGKVLAIHVENDATKDAMEYLKTFDSPLIVDDYMSEQEICDLLTEKRSQGIFCILGASKKKKNFINLFSAAVGANQIQGKKLLTLPVLLVEHGFEDLDETCFVIEAGSWERANEQPPNVIPLVEELSKIDVWLNKHESSSSTELKKILSLAGFLAYLANQDIGSLDEIEATVDNMILYDEAFHDRTGVDSLFLYAIDEWMSAGKIKVCQLPNVDNVHLSDYEMVVFYDEQFVFISDSLFHDIVQPITDLLGINSLKLGLKECGILVSELNSPSYSVKMNFYKENGKPERLRMLRFNQEKLSRPGEMDFISACLYAE